MLDNSKFPILIYLPALKAPYEPIRKEHISLQNSVEQQMMKLILYISYFAIMSRNKKYE